MPYGTAVVVERFEEQRRPTTSLVITGTILVDRPSHKGIVIGAGGTRLKDDRPRGARGPWRRCSGTRVFLELFVRVEPGWADGSPPSGGAGIRSSAGRIEVTPEALPVVAIVGRPNVGKSTLFNRLVRPRRAIVDDAPGVTRDRVVARGARRARRSLCVDTGGFNAEPPRDRAPSPRGSASRRSPPSTRRTRRLRVRRDVGAGRREDRDVRSSCGGAASRSCSPSTRSTRPGARRSLADFHGAGVAGAARGVGGARPRHRRSCSTRSSARCRPRRADRDRGRGGRAPRARRTAERRQVVAAEPPARRRARASSRRARDDARPRRHAIIGRRPAVRAGRHRRHPAARTRARRASSVTVRCGRSARSSARTWR